MRRALKHHIGRLEFILATEVPLASSRIVSSFAVSTVTSSLPTTAVTNSTATTTVETPTSKRSRGCESTRNNKSRISNIKPGMRLGGASTLFKPRTPGLKNCAPDDPDDSAGSPPEANDSDSMPTFSASKNSTVLDSPSEHAARSSRHRSASGKTRTFMASKTILDHSDPGSDTVEGSVTKTKALPFKPRRSVSGNTTTRCRKTIFDSDSTSDIIEVAHPLSKSSLSPFEVAARAAEIQSDLQARRFHAAVSSSDEDEDISFKPTVRKVRSAGNNIQKKLAEELKFERSYCEIHGDVEMTEAGEGTPTKKQKMGGSGLIKTIRFD